MRTSEQLLNFAPAMAKAQGEIRTAAKSLINPHLKNRYADLKSLIDACRPALSSNGLSVLQDVTAADSGVAVTTRILHTSGEWVECGPLVIPVNKNDAQGVGSATSYAKRYALSAAVGVVSGDEDDDGDGAGDGKDRAEQTVVDDAKKALAEADSLEQLKSRWKNIYKVLAKDTAALKKLGELYEGRTRELEAA